MNSSFIRMLLVAAVAGLALVGWFWKEERMVFLEAENARLLDLLNNGRLIGSMKLEARDEAPVAAAPVVEEKGEAPRDAAKEELEAALERIEGLESELAEMSLPLEEPNVASAVVNAAVLHGETLVTGGYVDGDGNFVFTMATPAEQTLDNGESAILFAFKEVVLPAESVVELGLSSIATGARNTLQNGETWSPEETRVVMERIGESPGSALVSAPSVLSLPGQQAEVYIGEGERSRTIRVNAEALPDDSGYALRMRVEHRGVEDPVAEASP